MARGGCMYRKTEKDYRTLARGAGLRWIGDKLPTSTLEKTLWQCAQGHQFSMRYGNVYQGRRCPVCSGRKVKEAEDYRRLAKEKGVRFVGPLPANTRTETTWARPDGVQFLSSYRKIEARRPFPLEAELVAVR